jgi:hypothetical protein
MIWKCDKPRRKFATCGKKHGTLSMVRYSIITRRKSANIILDTAERVLGFFDLI